jgi:hypothetical protein
MPKREPTPPKGAASNEPSAVIESSSAEAMPAESAMCHTRKATAPHATKAAVPRATKAAVPRATKAAVPRGTKAAVPHTAPTTATKPRVRAERRADGDTPYRGQRNHDLAQHDAFSIHPSYIRRPPMFLPCRRTHYLGWNPQSSP